MNEVDFYGMNPGEMERWQRAIRKQEEITAEICRQRSQTAWRRILFLIRQFFRWNCRKEKL